MTRLGRWRGRARPKPSKADNDVAVARTVNLLPHSRFAGDILAVVVEDDAQGSRAAATMAARAVAALPWLTGALIYGDNRRALFAGVDGAKPMAASEGAEVADFKVRKIEAGQVTLLGPDGTRVVRPTFDPRAVAGLASVPNAPDSAAGMTAVPRPATVSGTERRRVSAR